MSSWRAWALLARALPLCALSALGCAAMAPPAAESAPASEPDASAFAEARARLAALRARALGERTENVSLAIDAPYMPSAVEARGAVAVRPPASLRMILVGPGGTTAMDLWMGDGRFRFDIPALGRTIRGEPSNRPETRRGLPVDFLRWWMFEPLGGRLMAARRRGADLEILLDEPGRSTTVTLLAGGAIRAHRSWVAPSSEGRHAPYEEEWLEASGVGCAVAKYRQKSTSLSVVATCESTRPEANAAAFEEPAPEPAPGGGS